MKEQFIRTALLFGEDAIEKLNISRVAVFGVGGVGGYVVEALARSGVGAIDLIDNDTVSLSNINRQLIATYESVGRYKTEVAKERILSINPDCVVNTFNTFYLPETESQFDFSSYDYIVDAIDTLTAKIALVMNAQKCSTPIICSMGTGNKLDPTRLEITDIYKTSVCPLARRMRTELRKRGVKKLKVLYSKEEPIKPDAELLSSYLKDTARDENAPRRDTPGSTPFVPSVAGLIIAGEVIKDITGVR